MAKYSEWVKPEGLLKLEGWARDGLTDKQIAYNIEINVCTLYDWKNNYSDISNALQKGKEVVSDTTAQIFWLKNRKSNEWQDRPLTDDDIVALEKLDKLVEGIKNSAKR